ncbi:MAG: hypothetical protein ACE5F1_13250 [Planctomycetota bacterium]
MTGIQTSLLTLAVVLLPSCAEEAAPVAQVRQERAPASRPGVPLERAPQAKQEQKQETKFSRFVEAGETEGRFETAIVTYLDERKRSVDLIGAVHIGDTAYYAELQKRFESYDALLYELVAPKGTRPVASRKSNNLLSMFQRGLKNFLDLDFQLDAIDYTRDNFVHADMSPKQFLARQKEKGESMLTLILRAMLAGIKRQHEGKGPKYSMLHILLSFASPDRARYLKFLFAHDLDEIEKMIAGFGSDNASGTVIIGERNQEAIKVLVEQLEKGKKKLGIFYGAAHLPDLETRLRQLGFKKSSQVWITAWDVMKRR